MEYLNVLVAMSGGADDRAALEAATTLAHPKKGVVHVITVLPVAAQSVWAEAFGGAVFAADTIQAINNSNAEIRANCLKTVREVAKAHGRTFGTGADGGRIEVLPAAGTAWLALLQEAPLADLLVVGGSLARAEGYASGVLAEALMYTRTPVLVIRGDDPVTGVIAAIAWDGSLQAGRAVRACIPLLREASSVVILQDPHGLSAMEQDAGSPEFLCDELHRRGVKAASIAVFGGGAEGTRLLTAASEVGAKLLVSGAFGHSRVGETLWGGATRAFLKADAGPHLFLAH